MSIRDDITKSIVEKCENELNYRDIVNECTEKIDFGLIVEFILNCIFGVWSGENDN